MILVMVTLPEIRRTLKEQQERKTEILSLFFSQLLKPDSIPRGGIGKNDSSAGTGGRRAKNNAPINIANVKKINNLKDSILSVNLRKAAKISTYEKRI